MFWSTPKTIDKASLSEVKYHRQRRRLSTIVVVKAPSCATLQQWIRPDPRARDLARPGAGNAWTQAASAGAEGSGLHQRIGICSLCRAGSGPLAAARSVSGTQMGRAGTSVLWRARLPSPSTSSCGRTRHGSAAGACASPSRRRPPRRNDCGSASMQADCAMRCTSPARVTIPAGRAAPSAAAALGVAAVAACGGDRGPNPAGGRGQPRGT